MLTPLVARRQPYVACHRSTVPLYDERFRGYGLNKVSHLLSLSRTHGFVVCAEAWCVSPEMEKSNAWERIYGGGKDPKLAIKVQVLFDRFVGEVGEVERKRTTERGIKQEKKADTVAFDFAIDIAPPAKKTMSADEEITAVALAAQALKVARFLAFGFGVAVVVGRAVREWGFGEAEVEEVW